MQLMNRYLAIAIAMLITAAAGTASIKAYQHGFEMARALGQRDLAQYQQSVSRATAKAAADAFGRYAADATRAAAVEHGYLASQRADVIKTATLKEQIDHVTKFHPQTTHSRRSVMARRHSGGCYFSRDFVRVWNDAAGSTSAAAAGPRASHPPGSSAADATVDSGVSQADLLEWFIDYAARTRLLESKLSAVRAALPAQP